MQPDLNFTGQWEHRKELSRKTYPHTQGGQLYEQKWGNLQPTYDRILVTCSSATSRDHMPDEVHRLANETSQLAINFAYRLCHINAVITINPT